MPKSALSKPVVSNALIRVELWFPGLILFPENRKKLANFLNRGRHRYFNKNKYF
jgi:hypothetical protein